MATTTSAQDILKNWFDQLEKVLTEEARLAGFLGHGTMIGNAREFFVKRVLKTVLPPAYHIGSGRIIGSNGATSKQIDVIVYDPMFPVLEPEVGQGIYLAEGVVAAIEVKSRLDGKTLIAALDNCYSFTQINHSMVTQQFRKEDRRLVAIGPSTNRFLGCAYIFSFTSSLTELDSFSDRVKSWMLDKPLSPNDSWKLPAVVSAGSIVGLSDSWLLKVGFEGDQLQRIENGDGGGFQHMMSVWKADHPFGWLLIHILATASMRGSADVKKVVDLYLPHVEFWNRELHDKENCAITLPRTVS